MSIREMLFGRRGYRWQDEDQETRELYHRVHASYQRSPWHLDGRAPIVRATVRRALTEAGFNADEPSVALANAMCAVADILLQMEGFFDFPRLPAEGQSVEEAVLFRGELHKWERWLADPHRHTSTWQEATVSALVAAIKTLPDAIANDAGDAMPLGSARLIEHLANPPAAMDAIISVAFSSDVVRADLYGPVRAHISHNVEVLCGEKPRRPSELAGKHTADELARRYFGGTPFPDLFDVPLPFPLPFVRRFEHMHVVGGSGHGKTQALQQLILRDVDALAEGKGSLVVIDSQGDMIRTISHLAELSPAHESGLADRVVIIDPNDVETPPALNLFDFGLDRLDQYRPAEREKLVNGAIALYEYVFGALLGAELTQRQGVIFRYLARLLMVIPGATIHTLRELMEEPEATRAHFPRLDPLTRHFFESQFLSKTFDDTRRQILTRLWGILANSVLARMFSHERNRLNLFEAMNDGRLILINTAKDLLKQDGCAILGRFFIALIAQAAQERAAIPADRRRATFLYVDEAQDYFDESIEQLLNQARKYKVGLVLAHQNLDQFERRLQAAVMASTAIKLAGGVSAKDAAAFSKEMLCEPELLQSMRKRRDHSEFACFIKNLSAQPVRVAVPFGQMEGRPRMSDEEHEQLLALNRARYCASKDGMPAVRLKTPAPSGFAEAGPELL